MNPNSFTIGTPRYMKEFRYEDMPGQMILNSFTVVTPEYMKPFRYVIISNECGFIGPGISV